MQNKVLTNGCLFTSQAVQTSGLAGDGMLHLDWYLKGKGRRGKGREGEADGMPRLEWPCLIAMPIHI
eukprot:1155358-Pelagomonas_calceolata.AAC.10